MTQGQRRLRTLNTTRLRAFVHKAARLVAPDAGGISCMSTAGRHALALHSLRNAGPHSPAQRNLRSTKVHQSTEQGTTRATLHCVLKVRLRMSCMQVGGPHVRSAQYGQCYKVGAASQAHARRPRSCTCSCSCSVPCGVAGRMQSDARRDAGGQVKKQVHHIQSMHFEPSSCRRGLWICQTVPDGA